MNKIVGKVLDARRLPLPRQASLIEHKVEGTVIAQRPDDGYINATAMCKKAGKLFADYSRLSSTQEFLSELSAVMGIPITVLIQVLKGGNDQKSQGTWVHPDIAINLAQWLSPRFAVQVSKWVREWMQGGALSSYMPDHVKRYMTNRGKIPPTHFSMLNEIYLHLLAPMEHGGYILPTKMVPDASTGRMFSKFLRDKGINPNEFPEYDHEFLDGKRPIVKARLYPNQYLPDFRAYFHEIWLPRRAAIYFRERDPTALPHIKQIIASLPAPKKGKD